MVWTTTQNSPKIALPPFSHTKTHTNHSQNKTKTHTHTQMGLRLSDLPGYEVDGQGVYENTPEPEEEVPAVEETYHEDVVIESATTNTAARKIFEAQRAEEEAGVSGLKGVLSLTDTPLNLKDITTQLHAIESEAGTLLGEPPLPDITSVGVDPTLLGQIASLEKLVGSAPLPSNLLHNLTSLSSRAAHLDAATLKASVSKLKGLLKLMQETIDKKQYKGGVPEGEWQKRLEKFTQYEHKADEIPPIVERLLTLRPLHDRALASAAALREVAVLEERANIELLATKSIVESLSKQIPSAAAQAKQNEDLLERRMARLARNLEKLEAAKQK